MGFATNPVVKVSERGRWMKEEKSYSNEDDHVTPLALLIDRPSCVPLPCGPRSEPTLRRGGGNDPARSLGGMSRLRKNILG